MNEAASSAPRPFLIVYNPASGRRRGEKTAADLAQALDAREVPSQRIPTRPGKNVFETVDSRSYRGILILGGDGRIHAAINGLARFDVPLGFLGTGTINVLSRELSLPTSADSFAAMIERGRTLEVPLLRASTRRCLLFAEIGFLGRVVTEVNAWRETQGRHGRLEYLWIALKVLPRSWGRPLRATYETTHGEEIVESYANVLVTRARRYAGTMPMPIDPAVERPLEEPSFQVIGYRTRTPLGHLLLLVLAGSGLLPRLRKWLGRLGLLDCRRATRIRVEGPAGAGGHVDAEPIESLPLEVSAAGESFRLFVP